MNQAKLQLTLLADSLSFPIRVVQHRKTKPETLRRVSDPVLLPR